MTAAVLAWGVPRLRDLPWRRTRDPWAVLVSEVMLQQTQVPRVVPSWFEFLDAYPTPAACAAAPLGDVLRLWQGLGYPRRARNLHATAQRVTELGGFPTTLDGLLALPGVGPYTARAVLAFAFEADVAVVDTNIARVLARLHGRRLTPKQVQAAADELVAARRRLGVEPGADGSRRGAVPPGVAGVRRMPAGRDVRFAGVGDDPAVGSAAVSVRQAPLRGQRPPGPRPAPRRARGGGAAGRRRRAA